MHDKITTLWNVCFRKHKNKLIFITAMSIIAQSCYLSAPLIVAWILDFATETARNPESVNFSEFQQLVIFLFVVSIVGAITYQLGRYVADVLGFKIPLEFKGILTQAYLSRDLSEIEKRDSLRVVEVANNSAIALNKLLFYYSKSFFENLITIFVGCSVLAYLDLKLAFIFLSYIAAIGISQFFLNLKINKAYRPMLDEQEKNMAKIVEALINFRTLRFLGMREGFVAEVNRVGDNAAAEGKNLVRIARTKWGIFSTSNVLFLCSGYAYIGYSIAQGDLKAGVIVVFATYSQRLTSSLEVISVEFENFISYFHTLSRALDVFSWNSERGGNLLPNEKHSQISIQNLNFSYEALSNDLEPNKVLAGVNLDVKAGEKVAILGRSGSGKSTLLQLLTGSYSNYSGQISFGGQALSELNHFAHMQEVLYIPQNSELFNTSVRENISLGYENEDNYRKAIANAHCNFIEQLEAGSDTIIGNKGSRLSGGEGQRVGLARVFMHPAVSVLLFDEATSQLDVTSSKLVLEAIFKQFSDSTILYATHRENEVEWFDRVISISSGKII